MKMTGSCHVCGKSATQSCRMCGSITCDQHIDKGICTSCKKTRKEDEREDISYEDYYS